ncbi:Tat pathway signal sequence domain protein, partial [Asticcacaulis sp. BYS171W]|nr:Tat pathway signal sequence domain protein [Asticcacaulis aquaticus]
MPNLSLSRRHLLQVATAFGALSSVPWVAEAAAPVAAKPVSSTDLKWLDGKPNAFEGGTLGVPWPRGTVKLSKGKTPEFKLGDVPVQSWPIAYWPDGSLKWTAHAVAGGAPTDGLSLTAGKAATSAKAVSVKQAADAVTVTSGDLVWVVPTSGEYLIASATRAGRLTLKEAKLVALWQDQPDLDATGSVNQQKFTSKVTKVTVEQTGPVRAVLKVEGTHSSKEGGGNGRDWLPFSVRLYFYAGSESVRIVHSFIYDGDPAKDFIRGLGVTAKTPMTEETHNRHIRLSGDGVGVWGEAVRPITGLRRDAGKAPKAAQIEGKAVAVADLSKAVQDGLKWIPEWGDFSLSQLTPDGYTLKKRTRAGHAWIDSNAGTRTKGLAYVGGV